MIRLLCITPAGGAGCPAPKNKKNELAAFLFPPACVFPPFPARGDLVPLPHCTDLPSLGQGFGHMGLGQSGANSAVVVVDIVAIDVDIAVIVDIGGIIAIIAGRPQPPPRRRYNQNPR